MRRLSGALDQHHALTQRRMPVFRQGGENPAPGELRSTGQRQRDDARLGRSAGGELRGLGGILAQHQFVFQRL
ncbi:MAG: hypothetical protein AAB319_04715, partial [Pseudomonadota bacterium]